MRFGPWHRLRDAAIAAPPSPGVLQVRREEGLELYPRGKSAMIHYTAANDLRVACAALAAAHQDAAWLCRFNADPIADPRAAAALQIADFIDRFGEPPTLPATLSNPELAWEPSIQRPLVDRAFVDARLARWPALLDRPFTVLSGGLRSLNLRIGDVVARLALESPSALLREAALLRSLAGRVRVPRVIDGDEHALLLEHVPHAELPATFAAGERVGATAAKIHAVPQPACGFLGDDGTLHEPCASALDALHAWIAPALHGLAGQRLGPLAAEVTALWTRHADAMIAAASPCVLVHSDFKVGNVKWLPATHEVLVLDWEFAWSGPALSDVGQLLRWDPPAAFTAGFERGYLAGGGRLPHDWQRLAACLDLFNLVHFLAAPEDRPRRTAAVLARIARTLAVVQTRSAAPAGTKFR